VTVLLPNVELQVFECQNVEIIRNRYADFNSIIYLSNLVTLTILMYYVNSFDFHFSTLLSVNQDCQMVNLHS
jgi:hypothetical protein